jgi:hypothetical protein
MVFDMLIRMSLPVLLMPKKVAVSAPQKEIRYADTASIQFLLK